MQTIATTPAGVPAYRSEEWHNALNPDTDTIALALATQAYSSVIEPTVYRAAYRTFDALTTLLMAHVPTDEREQTRTRIALADNLIGSLAIGTLTMTAALLRAARDTFDPLDTMEANLQRALTAMGITSTDTAATWGMGQMAIYLGDFRAQFPDVILGDTGDDEDGEDGAACNS